VLVIVGWNAFWCRPVDPAATKGVGSTLLFGCLSAFLSLLFGTLDASGKSFRAGGYGGDWDAQELSEDLNRTGSGIGVLPLIFLAIIMSTQFSFGRAFRAISAALKDRLLHGLGSFREWREERRREKQRRDVIAKHTKKGALPPDIKPPVPPPLVASDDDASRM